MVSGSARCWLLPVFAVLGVLLCLFFTGSKAGSPLNAQAQLQTGAESGILVIPVQIDRDKYGLAMVDTVNQTLWIYELNGRGPAYSRLKLLAARSWRYDRLLQQYNTDEPRPEQVKALLEDIGRQPEKKTGERPQAPEVNIVEMAEPNDSNSAGR